MHGTEDKTESAPRRTLLVMVAAALLLRLVAAAAVYRLGEGAWPTAWDSEIWNVARALAAGNGFSSPFPGSSQATAVTTPVYPMLLAAGIRIFGDGSAAAGMAAVTLGSLFSALTVIPIFFLACDLLGGRLARATAWVWVFFPFAIYVPIADVWETSFSALLLAGLLWLTLRLERHPPRFWGWTGYGLLWGAAGLTSAVLLGTLPFLAGWLAWRLRGRVPLASAAALGATGVLAVLAPWTLRNYLVFHEFVPLRSNFGLELRVGNTDETDEPWRGWLHPNENAGERQRYEQLGEMRYMQEKRQQAMAFIREHPGTFAWLTLKRVVYTWTGAWKLSASYLWAKPLEAINIVFTSLLTVLAAIGGVRLWRQKRAAMLPYALVILSFPLAYYVTHVKVRYRHPIDPYLVMFATATVAGAKGEAETRP